MIATATPALRLSRPVAASRGVEGASVVSLGRTGQASAAMPGVAKEAQKDVATPSPADVGETHGRMLTSSFGSTGTFFTP